VSGGFADLRRTGDLAFNLVEHSLVTDFTDICCLDFHRDAYKGASQRVLGRSVQHLISNLGGIGRPADENHLVPLPTICCLKLEVVNSPPTLVFGEVTEEFVIICGRARLLDDDLGFVFAEVIDDVFVLVFKLESLELEETGIIDAYTR